MENQENSTMTYTPVAVEIIQKDPSEKKGIKGVFQKIWKFIKKHKVLSILFVVVILIVIWIMRAVSAVNSAMNQLTGQAIATELQKMDLVSSVSVTGSLISADDRLVSTNLANIEIESVDAKVGDYVEAGQAIITFNSDDLEYQLKNNKDQAALDNFKAAHALDTANDSVTDANQKYTTDAASTQQDVNEKYAVWQQKVAEEATAKATYEALLDQKEDLYAAYTTAENAYNAVKDSNPVTDEEKAAFNTAKTNYETAKENYDAVDAAEQAYKDAQEATGIAYGDYYGRLNDQTATMKEDAEKIEESSYNQTETQMENNLQASQQNHTIAEVEEQLGKVVVTAPISGVITAVNVKAGDSYAGTVLFEIQDLNNMVVDANVEEYDVADIYNDLTAVVKTDATDDTEFHGVVTFVSPTPTSATDSTAANVSSSSATTYEVKITLNDSSERLRIGMTAKTSIILDEKDDVFAVAYDSIKEDENGYYIEIVDEEKTDLSDFEKTEDNSSKDAADEKADTSDASSESKEIELPMEYATKKIYVTKGMESDYYVEIISDELKEGMKVVSTLETDTMSDIYDLMEEDY